MSDEGTPRGAQIAMLGVAAATLILSDPSERSQRLEAAGREIAPWPADGARLKERLESDCGGRWKFDLPPTLNLAWFDANLLDTSECVDSRRGGPDGGPWSDPLCTRSDAGSSWDAGSRQGVVAVRGHELLALAPDSDAGCQGLAARAPEGDHATNDGGAGEGGANAGASDRTETSLCDVLPEGDAVNCQPANWWIKGTVALAPAEGPLEAASRALQSRRSAERRKRQTETDLKTAHRVLAQELAEYGVQGASGEQLKLNGSRDADADAGVELARARAGYDGTVTALKEASAAARDAPVRPESPYVLIGNGAIPFWFVARGADERTGTCVLAPCLDRQVTGAGSSGVPALDACVATRDVEVARDDAMRDAGGTWTSCTGAGPLRPSQLFDVGLLARAGVWNDLRDDDPLAAGAKLKDLEANADLEGEVFGLKLEQRDAVRWAWLPIAALEAYAIRMLRAKRPGEDSKTGEAADGADPWAWMPWQVGLAVCSIAVVAFSVWRGLFADTASSPLYRWAVGLLLSVFVAGALARKRRSEPAPVPAPELPSPPPPATDRGTSP